METNKWENMIEWWSKSYFTIPLLFFCMLTTLIVGIAYFKKNKLHILFLTYTLTGILLCPGLDFLLFTNSSFEKGARAKIVESGNLIYALLEFASLYYFFKQTLISTKAIFTLSIALLIYIAITILFLFQIFMNEVEGLQIVARSFRLNSIEFLLLLFPCLIFFYEEMKRKFSLANSYFNNPSIIISTGLFFYIITSLPFIFIGDYLSINFESLYRLMFSIHFISLSFYFICLAKSFTCKPQITK